MAGRAHKADGFHCISGVFASAKEFQEETQYLTSSQTEAVFDEFHRLLLKLRTKE
ncbi:hypothetical protein NQZ68_001833 [Dissostichus eleginoides]|nr:hypothetical protein NQZ68_001833 [Dissostichus eleginoides]